MPLALTDTDDDRPSTKQRRDLLKSCITESYPHLCASALAVIYKGRYGSNARQMSDLAEEVVHEAVSRAFAKAAQYDPSQSPLPWLMRYIMNVLKELSRKARREPRQSDLGDPVWSQLLDVLGTGTPAPMIEHLPRLDQAMREVTIEQRQILELHFHKGLQGEELAQAVGAPSSGAARVRVHRALKALRHAFFMSSNNEEG